MTFKSHVPDGEMLIFPKVSMKLSYSKLHTRKNISIRQNDFVKLAAVTSELLICPHSAGFPYLLQHLLYDKILKNIHSLCKSDFVAVIYLEKQF